MQTTSEWLSSLKAQIHFKEDSIPGVRAGELTEETKQAILARIAAERKDAVRYATELPEWDALDKRAGPVRALWDAMKQLTAQSKPKEKEES